MTNPSIIHDLTLERYRLNELPVEEAGRLNQRLATDAELNRRLAALDASDAVIRAELPPAVLARDIASRLAGQAQPSPAGHWLKWAVPAGGALLLAVLVVRPLTLTPSATPVVATDDGERVKGADAALAIYRRTEAGSELLADGDRGHSGDLLRIGYKVADAAFGIIVSVDGRGLVTMHLPADGGRAVPLDRGDTVLLDRAYELDDAPKWERFYLVTGRTAFEVEPVLTAIRNTSPSSDSPTLSLGPDLGAVTFVIQKDTRP